MKYIDGSLVEVGDIFTDGSYGREDVRLKNRAKVLYVDKFTLVWFPLNDFTTHTDFKNTSKTWCLSAKPKKVEISELTVEELNIYNETDHYLKHSDE
jgi:hypothetical protein